MGLAKMSNEHIAVLEDGGHEVRCRTITRRPKDARWDGQDHLGSRRHAEEAHNPASQTRRPLTKQEARAEGEVVRRNVRITNWLLENMARLQDALFARRRSSAGPEAGENPQMPAVTGSRSRCLTTQLRNEIIEQRDERRPTGKATSSTSAAPEVLHATVGDQEETNDDELMNDDGGPAGDGVPELSPEDVEVGDEADEEHDVLYGPPTRS